MIKRTPNDSLTRGSDTKNAEIAESATLTRIQDLEEQWRLEVERLTLWQNPIRTLYVFISASAFFMYQCTTYILKHPIFLRLFVPVLLFWAYASHFPGMYTPYIDMCEFTVEYIVWWVGLGVLSSIGLGSGLQTGVLFLFPHIMKVCLTAEACGTVDFESFSAIWFRNSVNLFRCPEPSALGLTPATYFRIWRLVIVPSFLQSAGTAIGEIPPYWITKAARLAAIQAGERAGVPEELESVSNYAFINKVKAWLVTFLKSNGFFGVFLMAAWPNFAFDLCGICCGHFLMPFWTFFGATLLGKAFVRNTYQTFFLVAIFNERYLERFILVAQNIVPDQFNLDTKIRKLLEDFKKSSHEAINNGGAQNSSGVDVLSFSFLWSAMMTIILIFFLMSCIQQFAQFYQTMKNNIESDRLRSLLPPHLRDGSGSPIKSIRSSSSAEILFVQKHSPNPVVINRGNSDSNQIPQAARTFANKIRSQSMPKYDIVYLSTSAEGYS